MANAKELKDVSAQNMLECISDELKAAELQMDPKTDPEMSLHIHTAHTMTDCLLRANEDAK